MFNEEVFQPLHSSPKSVLLAIEDSEQDYEMIRRAVQKSSVSCDLHHCETGEEALQFLRYQGIHQNRQQLGQPALILLDLNLPGTDGREILSQIKQDPQLKQIPVVIFSTSSSPKDIAECYQRGANAYVIKPMDIALFRESINLLMLHWLKVNIPCTELSTPTPI